MQGRMKSSAQLCKTKKASLLLVEGLLRPWATRSPGKVSAWNRLTVSGLWDVCPQLHLMPSAVSSDHSDVTQGSLGWPDTQEGHKHWLWWEVQGGEVGHTFSASLRRWLATGERSTTTGSSPWISFIKTATSEQDTLTDPGPSEGQGPCTTCLGF